ncbi:hypothetical protein B0H14DRAFT_3513088 [Mycena olivaceomarginata]|nr:hypothetical protein B0H14DRAFT_3513088 [Mycena olivaceomarginata]
MLLTSVRLPATPRATESKGNDFAGMSLTEIKVFVRDHKYALKGLDISVGSCVIIDQKELEIPMIPHEEAYQMVAGLDIANRPLWMRAGP